MPKETKFYHEMAIEYRVHEISKGFKTMIMIHKLTPVSFVENLFKSI